MRERLPESINPWQLAAAGVALAGRLPLADMERLASLAKTTLAGDAEVSLRFAIDGDGWRWLGGRISAPIELVCQRCMLPFTQRLEAAPQLALMRSEAQLAALPDRYEPLITGDVLSLETLAEDELILALPLVPKHDPAQCSRAVPGAAEGGQKAELQRPFADLARLFARRNEL